MANKQESVSAKLAAFRLANTVEIELPTESGEPGLTMQLRKTDMESLVLLGDIPDALTGIVDMLMDANDTEETEYDTSFMRKVGPLFDLVVQACTVFPPLAQAGDDEHLGLNEIPFAIKEAIFSWANGEADALLPFRKQPASNADAA